MKYFPETRELKTKVKKKKKIDVDIHSQNATH